MFYPKETARPQTKNYDHCNYIRPIMEEERLTAQYPDEEGLVNWLLMASKDFTTTWNKERTLKLHQTSGSNIKENAERVLKKINSQQV